MKLNFISELMFRLLFFFTELLQANYMKCGASDENLLALRSINFSTGGSHLTNDKSSVLLIY